MHSGCSVVVHEEDHRFSSMVEDDSKLSREDQRLAEMWLVIWDMENLVCIHIERKKVGDDPVSLCTLLPGVARCSSKWTLKRVQECLGISCEALRDLKANLGPYLLPLKRATIRLRNQHRKKKELKRLTCTINYDAKVKSVSRERSKGRASSLTLLSLKVFCRMLGG